MKKWFLGIVAAALIGFPALGQIGGGVYGFNFATIRAALGFTPALGPYSAANTYAIGDLTYGTDGNVYRAIAATTGNAPTTDCGTYWKLHNVLVDTSLAITSRCATFDASWQFAKATTIAGTATLTHQFADGTYSMPYSTYSNYDISHPFGRQIQILGNETTKANVVLNWTGSFPGNTALLLQRAALKKFSGFTVNAPAAMSCAGCGTPYLSMFIYAIDGSSITMDNYTINNFYSCIAVHFNSTARVSGTNSYQNVCTGGGDGTYWAYGNSSIFAAYTTSTGANTHFSGSGYLSDNQSYVFAINTISRGNLAGFTALNNSSIKIDSATIGGAGGNANSVADVQFYTTTGAIFYEGTPTSVGSTNKIKVVPVVGLNSSAVASGGYTYMDSSGNFQLMNSGSGEYRTNPGSRFGSNADGVFFGLPSSGAASARLNFQYFKTPATTVAALTAAATVGNGTRSYVTDAVACTRLVAVTGGGAAECPVVTIGGAWVAQ